jgi:hypothetical protein
VKNRHYILRNDWHHISEIVTQLEAELNISGGGGETLHEITFTLRNRKGITGNRSYTGEAGIKPRRITSGPFSMKPCFL